MPSVTDMLDSISIAKSAPLSAGSIFKNPALIGLSSASDMTSKLSMIPGLDMSSFSSKLDGLTSFANTNIESKLSSLPSLIPMINANQSVINSIANVDGVPNPLAGCGFVDEVMKSMTSAGDMIDDVISKSNKLMNKAMSGISGAIDFGTASINEVFEWVQNASIGLLSDIKTAVSSVMSDIADLVDSALTELKAIIAKETELLSNMVTSLLDFSFLKGILNFGSCGNSVMDKVINPLKIDATKIAQL